MHRHPRTGMLWIRKVIPAKLRPYFDGKRELLKSLETKDQGKAEPIFHAAMADISERLERARMMARGETPSPVVTMHLSPEQQANVKALRLMTPEVHAGPHVLPVTLGWIRDHPQTPFVVVNIPDRVKVSENTLDMHLLGESHFLLPHRFDVALYEIGLFFGDRKHV